MTKPRLDQGADYERGFVDGMLKQAQSSVDKAVNAMSQRKPLTDEEVEKIIKSNMSLQMNLAGIRADIEAAHNIKE
jgi:hypothetical protein